MKLYYFGFILLLQALPNLLFSQITLPNLFTDHMILQREVPIRIWGQTAPSVKINATLALESSNEHSTVAEISGWSDAQGNWTLTFAAESAGGPYQILLWTSLDTIEIKDVLIGEVWICSGQSNMEWALKNSKFGEEALINAYRPNLRLFHLQKIHNMYNAPFTKEQATAINQYDFFNQGKWVRSNPEDAGEFSAVGYYFASLLQDSLDGVPIGIIQNAVSGSPAQSWFEASTEEVAHWLEKETYHPWLAVRARENWGTQLDESIQHHPFEPGYLYRSAVLPLAPFSVKGVLWYQGESNATHPSSYVEIMERVIQDWRKIWGHELPFYAVQLPRIGNRSRWPEFRAAQTELLRVPNTGMVTLIDEGHPTDVHPTHKRVVGHRLAWLVLRQLYHHPTAPLSPELADYDWNIQERTLTLKINDWGVPMNLTEPDSIQGFELLGYSEDGRQTKIIAPKIAVRNNAIVLHYPNDFIPFRFQYAWKPFPEGNITNLKGMPLMPFGVDLPGNN